MKIAIGDHWSLMVAASITLAVFAGGREGSPPFLPVSDPFNGALKRLTQKANS
ncbi:MAG: hypothetical protein ACI9UA_004446 [Pseudoalteromonas tetraodonis]|jgi:hypothetical protein